MVVGSLSSLAVGVVLGVYGGDAVFQRNINFTPDGTTTGAVLQVNGVTEDQILSSTCTATGGNVKTSFDGTTGTGAKYNTCLLANPLTTSGTLFDISIKCGSAVAKALPGDLSIVKGRTAGSGTALKNFSNVSLGSGAYFLFSTGATVIPGGSFLKFNTLTAPGATADCKLRARLYDLYGN